jgi:acid phosphatase class B
MFDLNIKHDIDRYSPDTRQAIQNHNRRVDEIILMVESIQSLEETEKRLKDAGQYAHAETCGWTADQLDEEQYAARQFIKSTGHDLQQQIWREDLAIESADYKEAQA